MSSPEMLHVVLHPLGLKSGEVQARDLAKVLNGLQSAVYAIHEFIYPDEVKVR